MVDSINAVRDIAHHESGVSELEVRDSGRDCWSVLRVDLEEDRITLRISAGARRSGCDVALSVPDPLGTEATATTEVTEVP